MKIAIDVRSLSGLTGGIKNATQELLKAILKQDSLNSYSLYSNEKIDSLNKQNTKFELTKISLKSHPTNEIWQNTVLPIKLTRNKIEIFHSPAISIPLITSHTKTIITIHDMIPFLYPEYFPKKFAFYMQTMTKLSAIRADKIIVNSYNTKRDIVKILKIPEDKIEVTYFAPNSEIKFIDIESKILSVMKKYLIDKPYFLHVGTIEPRKNIESIIAVFESYKEKYSTNHKLVLVGNKGWLYDSILKKISMSKFEHDILLLEKIDNDDLSAIYSNASMFLFLSHYEGFGLPVLEAMKCNVPVILNNNSSLRELIVNKDFAFTEEDVQYKHNSISDKIHAILTDNNLQNDLIAKQQDFVNKFSWDKTASETIKIYENIIY